MPQEGSAPDAGGDILSQLGLTSPNTEAFDTSVQAPETDPQQHGAAEETTQPAPANFKFMGREYPSQAHAEAAMKQFRQQYDQKASHANLLQDVLKNPALREQAMKDPRLAESLVKLGLAKYEQDANARGEKIVDPDEVDWNGPEGQIASLRAEIELEREFRDLKDDLGRKLKPEEEKEVWSLIEQTGGHLTAKQAWMLTPSYQRVMAEKQNAAAQAASGKGAKTRPAPVPGLFPGQKIDTTKSVRDMNPTEFRESLRGDIEKMMG